jgi:thymidine phosphorylase
VEVNEAVAALEGAGPSDLMEVTLALGVEALMLARRAATREEAEARLQRTIDSGEACELFAEMVAAQGGDLDAPRPVGPASELPGVRSGYVASIDAEQLGKAIIAMDGGRQKLGDPLDHSTGLEMLVRLGDRVDAGQPLVRVFAKPAMAERVRTTVAAAIQIGDEPPSIGPLIVDRIT